MPLRNLSVEELEELLKTERDRLDRANSYKDFVLSISKDPGFPYALMEVFRNVLDAVMYLDEDLFIRWANPASIVTIRTFVGIDLTMEGLIGKHCFDLFNMNSPCEGCLALRAMQERRTLSNKDADCVGITRIKHLEIIAIPVYNGSTGCFEIVRTHVGAGGSE